MIVQWGKDAHSRAAVVHSLCKTAHRRTWWKAIRLGTRCFIPQIKSQPSLSKLPIPFTRTQIPIRLAFAMIINEAQGQTFKRVGILTLKPLFGHGQLYVALSRVRSQK